MHYQTLTHGTIFFPFYSIFAGFASFSLGATHTLIVKQDGSVWAAGENKFAQLGTGARTDPVVDFVEVFSGGANAVTTAGDAHSMVLKQDGSVWATGRNRLGQLGDGSHVGKNRFIEVISGGAKAVAAGSKHSLVVKDDGSVWATGCNMHGQLGDGSDSERNIFVRVLN